MSQAGKGRLNYRCPICFGREIDMDLLYDKEKEEYYCLRCPFVGTEVEILELNEKNKYRYKAGFTRIKTE
jgi:hypothetical protein